jgi:hypothetical protein
VKRFFFTRTSKLAGGRSVPDNSHSIRLRNQGEDQPCSDSHNGWTDESDPVNGIDPQRYLTQLLVNLPVVPEAELDGWLPDAWKVREAERERADGVG